MSSSVFTRPLELKQGKPAGKGTIMVDKVFVWKNSLNMLSGFFGFLSVYLLMLHIYRREILKIKHSLFYGQNISKTL